MLTSLSPYFQLRLLPLFMMGVCSGLPWALLHSTLSLWMKDINIDIKTIGLFALVGLPYSLKPFWAPLLDIGAFPLFKKLGKRLSWIVFSQLIIFVLLILISGVDPRHTQIFFGIAVCISFFAANQDIAIDAWRISFLKEHEQGIGIAASVNGFHAGKLISSAGVMMLAEYQSWSFAYFCMALLMLLGLLSSFWIGLREKQATSHDEQAFHFDFKKHIQLLWNGFQDLFQQQSIWLILFFIISFKLGDALLDSMLLIFLDDIGFSKLELAFANKTWGTINNIIGVILGGILVHRLGVLSALVYSGILQILSNLVFCFQAQAGHDLNVLFLSISIEKLSGGLATTAFVAYISTLCKREYAAVQYSLLTALASILRTSIQAFSGIFVVYCEAFSVSLVNQYQQLAMQNIQTIKWALYFVLTTFCALPSMLLLYEIQRRQKDLKVG